MKKIITILTTCAILLPGLLSCQNTPGTDPVLDPAIELKMREDFRQFLVEEYPDTEWKLEEIWVQLYFGNYSGCEVAYMGCYLIYAEGSHPIEVAGYTIVFSTWHEAHAYKDSKFYTLKEAYDAKLITKKDVYNLGVHIDPSFTERHLKPIRWLG